MNRFIEVFLNWWVQRPSNIHVEGYTAAVRPEHWLELSWVIFLALIILPVIISILVCYSTTRSMGRGFLIRWWLFMVFTALINAFLIFIFLSSKTFTGDEFIIYWKIPTFMVLSRALCGAVQTLLFYYLISILFTKVLGGYFNLTKFRTNISYPYPKLFKA